MALGSSLDYSSFLRQDQPQTNQYLTGNPSVDPNANTVWMDQTQKSPTTGINGGGGAQQVPASQPTTTPQQGTALGAISSGSFGNAPLGFDQAKWNDPNAGNSLKYQVGRMAASGMPIDQIASKVGAKVISPDKIQYPDGFVADIYYDYGGPNQRVQYLDQTPGNDQSSGFIQGAMGGQQNNQLLQWIMSLFGNQNPGSNNSTGGFAQPINRYIQNRGGMAGQPNMSGPIMNQTPQNQMWNNALPQQSLIFGGYQNPDQTSTPQPQFNQGNWNTWLTPGVPH